MALPSLPLPPAFSTPTNMGNSVEFVLWEKISSCAAALTNLPDVQILSPAKLDLVSPLNGRRDLASDIRAGFPYSLEHASVLCQLIAELVVPNPKLKGIITDLDNTLWRGILGEVGVDGISWDLPHRTHSHALYQELLASAGESGILLAVASKNDPQLAELALQRPDLVISRQAFFPVEVNWGTKSASVGNILKAWNIGADSVVFIDDSPLELAEVSAVFPEVHCLRFPVGNDHAVGDLLVRLRDLIGKRSITAEDRLRLSSIASLAVAADARTQMTPDDFLRSVDARISLAFNKPDERCFELINKTNQFNLNGRRIDTAAWKARLANPDGFLLAVSYQDKFGPLGKISVVSGAYTGGELRIDIWVMSCRAFSRRIEYHTLKWLFDKYPVESIALDYLVTDRNGPIRDFIAAVGGSLDDVPAHIDKSHFLSLCPNLYARVVSE